MKIKPNSKAGLPNDAIRRAYIQKLDFVPSLMDEVRTTQDNRQQTLSLKFQDPTQDSECITLDSNVQNEIIEITNRSTRSRSSNSSKEQKKITVKPISPSDAKTIEAAIAIAYEMANRNMQEMYSRSESDMVRDSPRTPSSPKKKKFSLRLTGKGHGSTRTEKRNFAEEAASIPNIQDCITESAKEAYNELVERKCSADDENYDAIEGKDTNFVIPKVGGSEHCGCGTTYLSSKGNRMTSKQSYSMDNIRLETIPSKNVIETSATLPRPSVSHWNGHQGQLQFRVQENGTPCVVHEEFSVGIIPNLLPLPPRDRTRTIPHQKPRQRKYPLIVPVGNTQTSVKQPKVFVENDELIDLADGSVIVHECLYSSSCESARERSTSNEPSRLQELDDSFDGQIEADMDSLDDIPEEDAPMPPIYSNSDHVSCEDLLDFACDFPDTKRSTQGRTLGIDSDEVRIMQKVLRNEVTSEECVKALNETDWDVHHAIKYLKFRLILSSNLSSLIKN